MNGLQKKCFAFSAGMHGLLGVILIGSAAFSDKPKNKDMVLLTMPPAQILDIDGAGGGSLSLATAAPPQSRPTPPVAQPQPRPEPQQVQPRPTVKPEPRPVAEPIERPQPRDLERETEMTQPAIKQRRVESRPVHHHHEIRPDFTPATPETQRKMAQRNEAESAASEAKAEARRLRRIDDSLLKLAQGVQTSGAQGTVVDMPGQGGGAAFTGYETVIYNAYFHAWITPDSVADRLAGTTVKIVVARDGSIISAEIVARSGDSSMDRSVNRALRAVTRLPPFPATARDEQRSFLMRFTLEAKEASG